ncbi:MAG: hypothetical protein J5983_00740 [Ruminococcus sp.]|nr:hypothetical protein [Ruminococcus sp.]
MYYIGSRYYDSEVGRWINADRYISTGRGIRGYNMYVYCGDDAVNNIDLDGTCYYNVNGVWSHDNWEYLGGYKRKPDPSKIYNYSSNITKGTINASIEYGKYAYRHAERPKNIGVGTFKKDIEVKIEGLDRASQYVDRTYVVLDVAFATGKNVYVNKKTNQSTEKIMWDMMVDVVVLGTGALIGIKIGMIAAPVLLVAMAGITFDRLFSNIEDDIREGLKSWVR